MLPVVSVIAELVTGLVLSFPKSVNKNLAEDALVARAFRAESVDQKIP